MISFRKNPGKDHQVARGEPESGGAQGNPSEVRRKILVVGKGPVFTDGVMDYAANLAQRLGYDLIALNLDPALDQPVTFFSPYKQHVREKFTRRARAAWEGVASGLRQQGIHCDQVVKFTDVPTAVKELNQKIKRIDFVITDAGITDEEITGEIPLPVFSITGYQGDAIMPNEHKENRSKLVGKTVTLGLATAALYAAVFLNSATVMKYFTKGGIYAALPVVTVFAFSFVHGTFAHNVWSLLGIEATKKVQPRVATKRPPARKRPRPQLRLDT